MKYILTSLLSLLLMSCSQNISEARRLIKNSLKSPDSAYFENEKILFEDKADNGTWYLYSGDVHAKNSFGATIREHYCVAFKLVPSTNQVVFYPNAVSKCSSPPTSFEIESMKAINYWGK